jgi:two-component system nitrogen regulation response regulator GlnG
MPLTTQTKILRVLQDGEFQRVGGNQTFHVDVRVIAATNKSPEELVAAKKFREDLYYRLNVVRIHLPPLRERPGDIPLLVDYFLRRLVKSAKIPGNVTKISTDALRILMRSSWPGNVRELENVIERSAIVARGDSILPKDLPMEVREPRTAVIPPEDLAAAIDAAMRPLYALAKKDPNLKVMAAIERELITRALTETNGNQVQAAKLLGISRATLRKRIEKFGIAQKLEVR